VSGDGVSAERRLGGLRILRPLGIRDFALLWTGMTVSLLGDGIYFVAIAWQVYELSNAPTALSVVGVAWTVPQVAFVLLSGVISDRFDRRRVMIVADVLRRHRGDRCARGHRRARAVARARPRRFLRGR
jgi:hypothetical protein